MFTIKANPTFDATLILTGQGREQKLNVTFSHRKGSEYESLLESIKNGDTSTTDVLLGIMVKWDADMDLSAASINVLKDEQPGADWAILSGYGETLTVARKGN